MEKKNKKALIIFISVAVAIVVGAILFVFVKNYLEKHKVVVTFAYVDKENITKEIEVGTERFIPDKMTVKINGTDFTKYLKVDIKNVDLTKLGTYDIRYYIKYKKKEYQKLVPIDVIDTEKPEITLKGKNVLLLVGEEYTEPGYEVTDNYDKDLEDKVIVKNEVDINNAGTYKITYTVTDTSGNEATAEREVTVKVPNVVVATPPEEVKVEIPKVVVTEHTNTIKKNKYNSGSIYLEGYISHPLEEENKLRLVDGENIQEFTLTMDGNNYSITINPDEIPNGNYQVYVNEERLLNKIAAIERLARAKVGGKLVTFEYTGSDEVNLNITDHYYQYDILINPGHGGSDTGAVNQYIMEKEMNLTVSMYEKCRYEAHGLSVYMTRTDDSYGDKMGPSSVRLHKVAYEMGYYGAVSKIVYSNHHNSIGNDYFSGYEILVAGSLTSDELANELSIASKWNNIFDLTENHTRFYARDYDTERIYSKLGGEIYSFKDNYAVNRIPKETANVKSIIFEGCYMSNKKEFNWYWTEANWYQVSEAKIETYLNYLGVGYNPDNTSCM